ncbi:type 1 fimbrial protein [Enterobacter bugandensis]|nr:type 1 fimbrial protein [Enterobacter bugandensis]
MRNVKIIATILCCLLSSSPLRAADVTVNFTGNIIDSTCTIDTPDVQVPIGDFERRYFKTGGTGTLTVPKIFTIRLSQCPSVITSASFLFEGNADPTDGTLLALTAEEGVAKGIGVRLRFNTNGTPPVAINQETLEPVANNGGSITSTFQAAYESTQTEVTPGKANATATVTIIYQ